MTTVPVPDTASPKRWRTFLRARFTREGAVGLYLTAGFFACALLAILFAGLADHVFDLHGTTPLDQSVTGAIEQFHGLADVEGVGKAHEEVEERAVVNGFGDLGVGPAGLAKPLDLLVGNAIRVPGERLDEFQEQSMFRRQVGGIEIPVA